MLCLFNFDMENIRKWLAERTIRKNGIFVHYNPPKVVGGISAAQLRQWARGGRDKKLEQAVLTGQGRRLLTEAESLPLSQHVPILVAKCDALHTAVERGSLLELQVLTELLQPSYKRGKYVMCQDEAGVGLLHKAVFYDFMDIAEYLVKNYPQLVHQRDSAGRTALHYAAVCREACAMAALLEGAGAERGARDATGRTPGGYRGSRTRLALPTADDMAKEHDKSAPGLVIKRHNIRIWCHDCDMARLQRVVWDGHGSRLLSEVSNQPVVRRFLEAVPYIMNTIRDIHNAVVQNNLEDVMKLSHDPVPPQILSSRDANNMTVMHKAAGLGHVSIMKYIGERYPQGINDVDNDGRTPLHYAAAMRDEQHTYNTLVGLGADESAVDHKNRTPGFYVNRPQEIDKTIFKSLPEAPRTPSSAYPSSWDWKLLDNDVIADLNKKSRRRNLKASTENLSVKHNTNSLSENTQSQSNVMKASSTHELIKDLPELEDSKMSSTGIDADLDQNTNIVGGPEEKSQQTHNELESIINEEKDNVDDNDDNRDKNYDEDKNSEEKRHTDKNNENINETLKEDETNHHQDEYKGEHNDENNQLKKESDDTEGEEITSNYNLKETAIQKQTEVTTDAEFQILKEDIEENFDKSSNNGAENIIGETETFEIKTAPIEGLQNSAKDSRKILNNIESNENSSPSNKEMIEDSRENDSPIERLEDKYEEISTIEENPKSATSGKQNISILNLSHIENGEGCNEHLNVVDTVVADNTIIESQTEEFTVEKNNEGQLQEDDSSQKGTDQEDSIDITNTIYETPESIIGNDNEKNGSNLCETVSKENGTEITKHQDTQTTENFISDSTEGYRNIERNEDDDDVQVQGDRHNEPDNFNLSNTVDLPSSGSAKRGNVINGRNTQHSVIEGIVDSDAEQDSQDASIAQRDGSLCREVFGVDGEIDPEVTDLINSSNMEMLATLVLNGEGSRLIGRESRNTELQAFLDNVPTYMQKINRVHLAAKEGNLRELQAALDRRKFAIARDPISPNGATPLHVATIFGKTNIMKYLGGRFPETLSAVDFEGRTALHYAAVLPDNGHYFTLLQQLGANSKDSDDNGKSAEDYYKNPCLLPFDHLLSDFGISEDAVKSMFSDKVPEDHVSSRRVLDSPDTLDTLERCYRLLASARPSRTPLSASSNKTIPPLVLGRFLRRPIFDLIKHRITKLDHDLFDVIWPAVKKLPENRNIVQTVEEDFPGGITAPDYYVYEVFHEFLTPLVKDLHNINVFSDLPLHPKSNFIKSTPSKLYTEPLVEMNIDPNDGFVISGTMECSRNIEGFELPLNLKVGKLEIIERILTSLFMHEDFIKLSEQSNPESDQKGGVYYTLNEVLEKPSEICAILASNGLLVALCERDEIDDCTRLHGKHWPYGRGVFVSEDKSVAIWINIHDHVRVLVSTSIDSPGEIGLPFSKMSFIMNYLHDKLDFVWHERLGHLSSRPTFLGAGIRFSLIVNFPGLTKDVDNMKHLCAMRGLQYRETLKPDIARISNYQCLSVTETNCFNDFATATSNLLHLETELSMQNSTHITTMLSNIFRKNRNSLTGSEVSEDNHK